MSSRPDWYLDWRGEDCLIVASGPSAPSQPIDLAQHRCRVIVINNSWKLAPWADVLYASDLNWWQSGIGRDFKGLKVSRSLYEGVHKVELKDQSLPDRDHVEFNTMGTLGAGGTSAFQAMNLAIQFGSKRIAFVGLDARTDLGRHWHGDHGGRLGNPTRRTAAVWRDNFDAAAPQLAAAGISVTNCSSVSAITAYPKMELEEWLGLDC